MKLLKKLIIAAFVIFPFGELLRLDLSNNITIKPLDIISGIITLVWLVLYLKKIRMRQIWYFALFPLIGLFALLINLTWLQPLHFLSAILYLLRWVSYLGIFFAVQQLDSKFKKKITIFLLVDGFIIVLFGYIQYFFFSDLKPLYYLGWDDHMFRLFSVFLDPNYTGAILVLYLLFLSGFLYQKISSIKTEKNKRVIFALLATIILTLVAIFLTFSRSSFLMLLIAASCFFIMIGKKRDLLPFLTLCLIFVLISSFRFDKENMNLFRTASSGARIGNYEVALSIIKDHPVFGIGFNSYRYAKDYYHIQTDWTNAPSHADAGVDNSFLFVLATTGVLGLGAYLFLWWKLLTKAVILYRKEKDSKAIVVITSCIGMFIHALFINSLFFPAIMFWLWIQMGLMESS
jgi:O-antigen ligase